MTMSDNTSLCGAVSSQAMSRPSSCEWHMATGHGAPLPSVDQATKQALALCLGSPKCTRPLHAACICATGILCFWSLWQASALAILLLSWKAAGLSSSTCSIIACRQGEHQSCPCRHGMLGLSCLPRQIS